MENTNIGQESRTVRAVELTLVAAAELRDCNLEITRRLNSDFHLNKGLGAKAKRSSDRRAFCLKDVLHSGLRTAYIAVSDGCLFPLLKSPVT
jgi:hypothetical protein